VLVFEKIAELPAFDNGQFKGSQAPCVYIDLNGYLVIGFSARDSQSRSLPFEYKISYRNQPGELLNVSLHNENPILTLGEPGHFDDSGVMISQVTPEHHLYYVGWNKVENSNVRYRTSVGRATFTSRGWIKDRKNPIYERSALHPIGISMPYRESNSLYYMNYTKWEDNEPFYSINQWVISGKQSEPNGFSILEPQDHEGGLARPFVWTDQKKLKHMLFSYRGKKYYREEKMEAYRIGYAVYYPDDGIWIRQDENFIIKNSDDDFMQAYPYLWWSNGDCYLLYNNHFTSRIQVAKCVNQ